MKFTRFATVACCAAAGTNAAFVPELAAGKHLENSQQVIANTWEHISSSYSQIVGALNEKKGDLVSKIAQYLEDPSNGISKDITQLWSVLFSEYPKQVSQLVLESRPKKASKNSASFDFHVSDVKLPNHKLRVKSTPKDLGIDSVKQYTGYLDVEDEDKHFFYWFFESRNDPKNDPLILWLNGGPGCSSMTGLFFELGPSSIGEDLQPVFNPYAWNNNASVVFLDQPVNVGLSYSSRSVSSTVAAGKDVYAFLELFFKQFPEYKERDFHIAGESYGGHYIPAFASEILSHEDRSFDLTSVLIGNGFTDPLIQYEYYQPMACGEGGEPSVLTNEECDNMITTLPRCLSLLEGCYNSGSVFACIPASIYCTNSQTTPYQNTGRNVYDIRTDCKGSDLCYEELSYLSTYLNQPEVLAKLGAEVESYQSCNSDVERNFFFTGDDSKPFQSMVAELLEKNVPVLIYAGDKDFICNWLGNQGWTNRLPWSGHDKFLVQPIREWRVNNKPAGEVKNFEHFTFLRVYGAGHMVPFDQPENSLDMVNRWINGDFAY